MQITWEWPEVDKLESQEKYKEAYRYMLDQFKGNPEDFRTFIRLSFLCWYVVVERGVLTNTDLEEADYGDCERSLIELTAYGCAAYGEHPDFLWIYGYMMSLFPEVFKGDYEENEKRGIAMLEHALVLRPDDLIVQLLLLNEQKTELSHAQEVKRKTAQILPERFKGQGEMQRYFREVLHRI